MSEEGRVIRWAKNSGGNSEPIDLAGMQRIKQLVGPREPIVRWPDEHLPWMFRVFGLPPQFLIHRQPHAIEGEA